MDLSTPTTSMDTARTGCPTHTPADTRNIVIDTTLPTRDRIKQYIAQVDDPYNIQVGKNTVHVSYTDNAPSLSSALEAIARMAESD